MRKMNVWKVRAGARTSVWLCGVALVSLSLSPVMAGADMKADTKEVKPVTCCSEKDWTIELGSGVKFSNVRTGNSENDGYTLIPIQLTASLQLDDVGLDNFLGGIFRGYTEFYFEGEYNQIVHGPEDHYTGIMVGPRYNFVQKGWCVIPFLEAGVGFGFANAKPQFGGLGQDFNFSFAVATGLRYNINNDWFLRVGCEYQHMSNAGMSEPTNPNHPIDALGPKISLGYSF